MWLISKKSTPVITGILKDVEVGKSSKQANVARLRYPAAMVNESTRSTHQFTLLARLRARAEPDEQNQKSSLPLTSLSVMQPTDF
jgi:hypothetical protein